MERKSISIEPYIEAGGILGTRLEVNPKAADSVMKRTALRRNVIVSKGYYRESRSYEGSDEIVVGKSIRKAEKAANEGKHYTLVNQGGEWVVFIHDQEISDDIQELSQKNRKIQPEIFDKRYIGNVNSALADAISTASIKEKVQIAKASSVGSLNVVIRFAYVAGVVIVGVGYLIEFDRALNLLPGKNLPYIGSAEPGDVWKAGVVIVGLGAAIVISAVTSIVNENTDKSVLKDWEHFIPHLPALSAGLGELSLEINRSRLVRLNDSK